MAKYRVRDGEVLAHDGRVYDAGAIVTLERRVADDPAVRGAVQEVDDKGQPVAAAAADDLAAFRTHERVGFLRERLAQAQARVAELEAQLAGEEQRLAEDVKALQAKKTTTKPPSAATAPAGAKE